MHATRNDGNGRMIQVSDANNKEAMISAIEKFEGTVMMPNVKTRMSDLFKANIK